MGENGIRLSPEGGLRGGVVSLAATSEARNPYRRDRGVAAINLGNSNMASRKAESRLSQVQSEKEGRLGSRKNKKWSKW